MPPVGFEPTVSAGERLQTHALNSAATGIGSEEDNCLKYITRTLLNLLAPQNYLITLGVLVLLYSCYVTYTCVRVEWIWLLEQLDR
jgi:hypothetical protein